MKNRYSSGQIVAEMHQKDIELGKDLKEPDVCRAADRDRAKLQAVLNAENE